MQESRTFLRYVRFLEESFSAQTMLNYVVVVVDDFRTALAEFEERLDKKLDAKLDARFAALRLDERFADARAHTDARFDELKAKLDIVYDGVVGVTERVGALELKLDTFEERVERRFDAIAAAARPSGPGRPVRPRRRR